MLRASLDAACHAETPERHARTAWPARKCSGAARLACMRACAPLDIQQPRGLGLRLFSGNFIHTTLPCVAYALPSVCDHSRRGANLHGCPAHPSMLHPWHLHRRPACGCQAWSVLLVACSCA
eukprot:364502-Chlamydomonas_euryale.AAC.3